MMHERNTGEPIRVLLADDHTMFRQGLAGILGAYERLEIVGQSAHDQEAIDLAKQMHPDVVVMQVQMPLSRARESLRQLRRIEPPPKVVICTMFENPRYIREFLELGVSAYILKSVSVEHLIGAIRGAIFDPQGENVVIGMPQDMLERVEDGSEGVLSAREMEILLLVSRGLSNREVASSLSLSEATIKRHLSNVYSKIGVHTRGEAVRKALYEEWITIQEVTQNDEAGTGEGR
ncbi:MAG: response regulator transcription factor [Rubrobacter sp.]|nr:response regulator transcription factor [Rubrobacter sp.]